MSDKPLVRDEYTQRYGCSASAPDGSKWICLSPPGTMEHKRLWMPAYVWKDRPNAILPPPVPDEGGFPFDPVRASREACLSKAEGVRSPDGTSMLPQEWREAVADMFYGSVMTGRGGPDAEGWREWGDAPTRGTEVLAYRPDAGVFMVFYTSVADERFVVGNGTDMDGDLPTHWMRTPAHPGRSTS